MPIAWSMRTRSLVEGSSNRPDASSPAGIAGSERMSGMMNRLASTTARIMTGMSQNFLRTIAKRHRSTRIRIAAPYWLQLASTPLLASARRVRNRSFRLATDHDVEAAVLAARQQHLDLAGEPIEAAA